MYWLSEEFLWRAIFEHVSHGLEGNFLNHEWMNWNDHGMILATWYLSYRSQSAIIWKRVSVLPARNKRWQISKQSDGGSSIWCTGTGNDVASDICPSSGIVSWRQDRIYLYSHTPSFDLFGRHVDVHINILSLNLVKRSLGRGFVKMSASCSVVRTDWIVIIFRLTYSRKWWYLMLMCLVRGRIFGACASSSAPELSSNSVQWIVGFVMMFSQSNLSLNSSMSLIIGMVSRSAELKLIYSLSVVERATSVCIFDAHEIGQPA